MATNCSPTRHRIICWLKPTEPPRPIFISPRISAIETSPIKTGIRYVIRLSMFSKNHARHKKSIRQKDTSLFSFAGRASLGLDPLSRLSVCITDAMSAGSKQETTRRSNSVQTSAGPIELPDRLDNRRDERRKPDGFQTRCKPVLDPLSCLTVCITDAPSARTRTAFKLAANQEPASLSRLRVCITDASSADANTNPHGVQTRRKPGTGPVEPSERLDNRRDECRKPDGFQTRCNALAEQLRQLKGLFGTQIWHSSHV